MSRSSRFSRPVNLMEHHVAPIELLEGHIRQLHLQSVLIPKMLPLLSKHYDTEAYGLGCILFISLLSSPFSTHVLGCQN